MENDWNSILKEAALLLRNLPTSDNHIPEVRQRIAHWKQQHPDLRADLAIDRPPGSDRAEYDLLLGDPNGGTLALSWRPDDGTPWSVCYADHWAANFVLSVDRRHVTVQQALQILRVAGEAYPDLLTELVDFQLVMKTAEEEGIAVSDDELQHAVDAFRARNNLYSAAAMRSQLEQLRLSWDMFEETVRTAALRRKVRDHVTSDGIESYFESHREMYDRVCVLQVRLTDAEPSQQLIAAARERGLLTATETLLKTKPCSRLSSTLATRYACALPSSLDSTRPGEIVGPVCEGREYLVAEVLRREGAELDRETREVVREAIYREWLSEKRASAAIQWHWM